MERIEQLQLAGYVLIALALIIIAATLATIVHRRRVDELADWVAEQDQAARDEAGRRASMPPRATVAPRPVSIDDGDTRPLTVPTEPTRIIEAFKLHHVTNLGELAGEPTYRAAALCGESLDHPAHYFIGYVETDDPDAPDMVRRPCPGLRSGPHRRRV